MRCLLVLSFWLGAGPALSDTVFAVTTLRAREVISPDAIELREVEIAGAAQSLNEVIGSEATRAIYAGQPVRISDIAQPALIERNQVVPATFRLNGLTIETEARALERGSAGDIIRAMNLTSRTAIRGEVTPEGHLEVLP